MSFHFEEFLHSRHYDFILTAVGSTFKLSHGVEIATDQIEGFKSKLALVENAPLEHIIVLNLGEDQVAGYFWYQQKKEGVFYLLDFYILPNNRGQGLGRALWAEIERLVHSQLATEERSISLTLTVSELNTHALTFYKRNGLKEINRQQRGSINWLEMAIDFKPKVKES
jgi:ribosomal protein S18 acetylase RimI-like enzyme